MKWLCPPVYWSPNPQREGVWRWVFGEVLGLKKVMSADPQRGQCHYKKRKKPELSLCCVWFLIWRPNLTDAKTPVTDDGQSVQAAITECHGWDGFDYRNLFLTVLEAGVLRSRGLQGQVKTAEFLCPHVVERALWPLFIRAQILFMRAPPSWPKDSSPKYNHFGGQMSTYEFLEDTYSL